MRKRFVLGLLVLQALLLGGVAASSASVISLVPSSPTASVGDLFSIDVAFTDAADLFAYQFDIRFDPAVLSAENVSDGGFLTSAGGVSLFGGVFVLVQDNTAGVVTVLDSLLGPAPPATGVSGSGVLVSFSFRALNAGVTQLSLFDLILEDSAGMAIAAQVLGASVQVADASAPEPGAGVLLLAGAILAAVRGWRQRLTRSTL